MILCCGEALIDMLPRNSTEGEDAFAPHAGGAVFNTAIALGRLGAPAGYFGGLSKDLFGTRLTHQLAASKVSSDLCPKSDRPTTLAFVTLTDGQATYAFYDENTAGRMLSLADLPDLGAECSALFFGGISLVSEPAANSYAELCLRNARQRVIMLDPNIRPGFITDESGYRDRLNRMLGAADIVKVSDEDLDWIGGGVGNLLNLGARLVVVTKGAKGAEVYRGQGRFEVAAKPAQVVDTVGAGDTFNAGLLAGLDRDGLLTRAALTNASDDALRPALDLGITAAAVTVARAGANPPWYAEL